jgi:undecaprenyl pyrophosphate phosphatase UppP
MRKRAAPTTPCSDAKQPLWPCNLSEGIDALTAAALGALQGVTEFLPVSSSGHVAIGAQFFGIHENSLALVILLHLGTLLATLIVLRRDVMVLTKEGIAALRDPDRLRSTRASSDSCCATWPRHSPKTCVWSALAFSYRRHS